MNARQERLGTRLPEAVSTPLTRPISPVRQAAARIVAVEPWLLVGAATVLLLAPNPLIWPAAIVGCLPLLARTILTGNPWRRTAFDLPLVLLAVGALLGGYASLSRDGTLVRLTGLLAGLFLFVLAREHAVGERPLRSIVVGALIGTVLVCAALLVLVAPFLLLEHVPPLDRIVAAVDRWQLGAWFVDQDWLLQRYRFRASGVGSLADDGLALALAAILGLRGRVGRLLAGLAAIFFLVVLVATDNRGSIVAAAMTLGIMLTAWRRRLLPLIPLGIVAVLVLVALSPTDRGLSMKTLAQRFWFWENSVFLAREVPLTGAGLGLESVQLVYRAYFLPAYPPFSHAHNVYLQGLLEYGVFGLAGLVGLGLATLWIAWRAPQSEDRWTQAGRLAGLGVALAMLTTGLTEIVMLTTLGGAIALAGLGLLAGAVASGPHPPNPPLPLAGEGGVPVRFPLSRARESGPWGRRGPMVGRSGGGVPRGLLAGVIGLLVVGGVLVATDAGGVVAGRLLLSLGTAELNRGALAETMPKPDRTAALDRAVALLRWASSASPSDPAIQRNLALALAANDDARRGRAAVDRAKGLTSDSNRQDLFQLGRAYVAVSAWGEAIRAWQSAEATPQLLQLGARLVRARNLDQAENAYLTAAMLDPNSRGAFDGVVAVARQRELSTDETIERLAPLLEPGSPTEYGARLEASRVYREAGLLRQAMAELNAAGDLKAGPDLAFETGMVALRAGLAESAEPLLERAATDQPYDPDNWLWLARAEARMGRHQEAVAAIRQGLSKVDPSGQFAPPAERLPETAAVLAVEIKRSERAPLLGVMGESLIALGRPGEALPALDEAVAALPNDPWLKSVRAAAEAGLAGTPPNLIANPTFAEDGAWVVRPPTWTARPTLETLIDGLPSIADGAARLSPRPAGSQVLLQEVPSLVPGARYRLTARVRGEGLGSGRVLVMLRSPHAPLVPLATVTTASAGWVTVQLEALLSPPDSPGAIVAIGLSDDAPAGATAWVDDVTLTRVDASR